MIPVEPDFVSTNDGESIFPIRKNCELLTSAFNYDPLHYPISCALRSLITPEEPEAQPSEICVPKSLHILRVTHVMMAQRLAVGVKVVQLEIFTFLKFMLEVKN